MADQTDTQDTTHAVPEDFAQEFGALMMNRALISVYLSHLAAWSVMQALQLALCHPEFPEMARGVVEKCARGFQERIATTPALARVAEQGWHRQEELGHDG